MAPVTRTVEVPDWAHDSPFVAMLIAALAREHGLTINAERIRWALHPDPQEPPPTQR